MFSSSCRCVTLALVLLTALTGLHAEELASQYQSDFGTTPYGGIPAGWRDLVNRRPSRNWAVDGNGFLRPVLKLSTGLLAYVGPLTDGTPAQELANIRLTAQFKKTEEDKVTFGIAARIIDRHNYYLARFRGNQRLELLKVKDGQEFPFDFAQPVGDVEPRATGLVTLNRYREGALWTLSLTLKGDQLTAIVRDAAGLEQARLVAVDDEFPRGPSGLCCTTFAAAKSFRLDRLKPLSSTAQVNAPPLDAGDVASQAAEYPVVRPYWKTTQLDTPWQQLQPNYDIVVAGAGTGGWAAAVQAARMGARVLLLEETDWIGGQMSCAGVTTMDEDSVWMKFPVRERGIYREFHESMATYYHTLDKDPLVAYFSYPQQLEGGYEPKVTRAVLYGFIQEARQRNAVLDVSLRTRVVKVHRIENTVEGATLEFWDGESTHTKQVACKVLIDATEYGDVIPLTGARYRVGNVTNDKPDPTVLVQDHTWTAIVREYPQGVPEHLQVKSPPPGYATGSGRRYRNYTNHGFMLWGQAGKGIKGRRSWRVFFTWRGMADSEGPLTGLTSSQRHTQCGFNGGNDYPVTVATIEDPAQRLIDERGGIYKTLGALYYFQQKLGVNWSLAEDEGYDTPYNRRKMAQLDLRPDLAALAVHLPQQPYVRECRRIMGIRTLVADDLTRYDEARHFRTSVAMGDYFMDLDHGKTAHVIETDLDSGEPPRGGGPFQIPFEVFIPETLDGFLLAEKNISQSRLVNGATRLQPVTMLTGQAVGVIAALSVKNAVPSRTLNPRQVQHALLNSGCTLIQRWYADVPWGTPIWRATQMLSLYQIMDRPGGIDRDNQIPLGSQARWGVDDRLSVGVLNDTVRRLAVVTGLKTQRPISTEAGPVSIDQLSAALKTLRPPGTDAIPASRFANSNQITAGEFALLAAEILIHTN